jgi:hypothetical protein
VFNNKKNKNMATNTLHAVAFGSDIEKDGRSQILFNQQEEKINKQPQWQTVHVPLSVRGQAQTEKDLCRAFATTFPNRRFAIGWEEKMGYSEVYVYDIAQWDSIKDYRDDTPKEYGKFRQLVRITVPVPAGSTSGQS